jgi:rhodanese-related sulfurtransferase
MINSFTCYRVMTRDTERVPHHPSITNSQSMRYCSPLVFTVPKPQSTTLTTLLSTQSRIHTTPKPTLRYPNPPRTMSTISLADLQYMSRETLAQKISSSADETLPANTAVVDVRDSDHIGGHIRGSTWIPSSSLDYKVPELVRELRDKEVVVFHCALSQQRGPSAALRYLRERERLDPGKVEEEEGEGKVQRVYVLKGGFTEWQEKYGEDQKLTEGYQKDIWEFGS